MPAPAATTALHVYTGGRAPRPGQPLIVLLHGAQHDHSVWILQSRWLAHHGYRVAVPDLPGHGRSPGPPLARLEDLADLLAGALRESLCGPAPVLVAGHSMGSLLALELALRAEAAGARVAGVALLGTAAPMRVAEALLAATRERPAEAMAMINAWSHAPGLAPFRAHPSNPGPGFNVYWSNLRLMERVAAVHGPSVLPTDFAACNAYDNGLAAIARLACPVLFVLGEADAMTPPKAARALIAAARRPEVVVLPATGHAMMAEHPEGVRRALADFAARVFAPPAANAGPPGPPGPSAG